MKSALSKVWSFAPENEETEGEKSKPDIESSEGKMSVAPDGKVKKSEGALISREDEGGDEKQ